MIVFKIEITSKAEEEYYLAYHYYEEQLVGLGNRFEKETGYLIEKLKENPFLFERKYKHYREANYKKFPYFIVYELIGNSVIIHSFFHSSRNPTKKIKPRT